MTDAVETHVESQVRTHAQAGPAGPGGRVAPSAPSPEVTRETVDVLGIGVSKVCLDGLLADLDRALAGRHRLLITFVNPNYLMKGRRDARLRGMINSFHHVLPDGRGVLAATRLLGDPLTERLANDDLTQPLFELLAERRTRVFLLGSAPGIGDQAAARLEESFPGLDVVGTLHGYLDHEDGTPGRFSPRMVDKMVDAVNAAEPDFLVVGLPTPKQQTFVVENLERLDVPVVMTGGAWIDHLAERIEYYPPLINKLGLCWAYRWFREPRRLAYRYTVELAGFAVGVLRQRLTTRR